MNRTQPYHLLVDRVICSKCSKLGNFATNYLNFIFLLWEEAEYLQNEVQVLDKFRRPHVLVLESSHDDMYDEKMQDYTPLSTTRSPKPPMETFCLEVLQGPAKEDIKE
jgi:hypothetical protein